MTQLRIRQWYDYFDGNVYVSFSGGKDSTVLKHIVDGIYNDVPAVFVNTGLEYPEIQNFVHDIKSGKYDCFNNNIEIIRPDMRFDEVIVKYGYPVISKEVAKIIKEARGAIEQNNTNSTAWKKMKGEFMTPEGKKSQYNTEKWAFMLDAPFKISSYCCDVMKKRPVKKYGKQTNRKPFIATLASESRLRYQKWLQMGCNAFENNTPVSQPMSFWTEQDILHYIKKFNVPYASVYGDIVVDEPKNINSVSGQITIYDVLGDYEGAKLKTTGCTRTGCIFCMFGCHLEKEPNRFQKLKETHPRQYEYCINGGQVINGKLQPNKEGLGVGKILDFINVKY